MPVNIDTIVLGQLETNCYVLRAGEEAWVVDPGMEAGPLMRFLREQRVTPSRILLTHGHGDHIASVADVKADFPRASVCCAHGDLAMLGDPWANMSAPFGMAITAPEADEVLTPGQVLDLGETQWQVLDTSGHTPGGVSFYCRQQAAVITGDALFDGSIGRTDLPGASTARLIANIRKNLLSLPDETTVLPGHGPQTTIGRERAGNPYL